MLNILSLILHLDNYLTLLIEQFGLLIYPILFLIIFLETGIVFTPFLPGDSLLFVAGTLASQSYLNIIILLIILSIAAILGDSINYSVGKYLGKNIIERKNLIKKENLQKTEKFFDKYGAKTIIIARFIPIVRTFAPFMAGIGKMKYSKFLSYNIVGGVMWVFLFLIAGYLFGNITYVRDNLSMFIILIIIVSIIPVILEYIRSRN